LDSRTETGQPIRHIVIIGAAGLGGQSGQQVRWFVPGGRGLGSGLGGLFVCRILGLLLDIPEPVRKNGLQLACVFLSRLLANPNVRIRPERRLAKLTDIQQIGVIPAAVRTADLRHA
jgi:hypothetical protein